MVLVGNCLFVSNRIQLRSDSRLRVEQLAAGFQGAGGFPSPRLHLLQHFCYRLELMLKIFCRGCRRGHIHLQSFPILFSSTLCRRASRSRNGPNKIRDDASVSNHVEDAKQKTNIGLKIFFDCQSQDIEKGKYRRPNAPSKSYLRTCFETCAFPP